MTTKHFANIPLVVVTPRLSELIMEEETFLPIRYYAKQFEEYMVDGEIGIISTILGEHRIIVDKPIKRVKRSICGCQEMLRNGLDNKRVRIIINGVCRYCGTKQK